MSVSRTRKHDFPPPLAGHQIMRANLSNLTNIDYSSVAADTSAILPLPSQGFIVPDSGSDIAIQCFALAMIFLIQVAYHTGILR